jgi:hypothetical protein
MKTVPGPDGRFSTAAIAAALGIDTSAPPQQLTPAMYSLTFGGLQPASISYGMPGESFGLNGPPSSNYFQHSVARKSGWNSRTMQPEQYGQQRTIRGIQTWTRW